jgi:hypothetical protein
MSISRELSPVQIMMYKKQLESMEYIRNLGSMITYNARRTLKIKSKTDMAKATGDRKMTLFTTTLDTNLRKKPVKCYIWNIVLYGAETWTLWTVLHRVKDKRNILHTTKRRINWVSHILCRNCLLKQVIEAKIAGNMEVMEK